MLHEILDHLATWWQWIAVRREYLLRSGIEVLIIWVCLYGFIRLLRGTRGAGVLKGLIFFVTAFILLIVVLSRRFELWNLDWVISQLSLFILIPLIILFQPEIRRAFIHIGQNPLTRLLFRSERPVTDELITASLSMSKDRVGGLIIVERDVGLGSYIEGGAVVDGEVSADLIKTIFWPGSPLHDGGVIIRQQRVAAAGCLFPLTENPEFTAEVGTRHRAGIGITEESDAIAIIISEQTGQISIAVNGRIRRNLDEKTMRELMEELTAEVGET
jgi:diadenylate cyclase